MDGAAFDKLVASRARPAALGAAVTPAHMAVLRRCWNAKFCAAAAPAPAVVELPVPSFFEPPARPGLGPPSPPPAAAAEEEAPEPPPAARARAQARPRSMPAAPAPYASEGGGGATGSRSPSPTASRRPHAVPRLDLKALSGKEALAAAPLHGHPWAGERTESSMETRGGGGDPCARPAKPALRGYAAAKLEDQHRIAEFYGFRDEGFESTMRCLKTDQIRPRLYLGTMADAAYWPLLEALSITHVVNCAVEAQKIPPPYEARGIKYLLLPLHDSVHEAETMWRHKFRGLRRATRYVRDVLKGKGQSDSVLVHCVQGMSRGAAVVCAYLMEYESARMDRAVAEVRGKHPGCLVSQHWLSLLQKFDAELLRGLL